MTYRGCKIQHKETFARTSLKLALRVCQNGNAHFHLPKTPRESLARNKRGELQQQCIESWCNDDDVGVQGKGMRRLSSARQPSRLDDMCFGKRERGILLFRSVS